MTKTKLMFNSSGKEQIFINGTTLSLNPQNNGQLSGLKFAVKDLIDVVGFKTGLGNNTWSSKHLEPAKQHAWCVEQLLNAGAEFIGKTHMSEFGLEMSGKNQIVGIPPNPNVEDCVPSN